MKRVLLKPQRGVAEAVLAYQDEGDDDQDCSAQYSYENGTYYAYWACDAFCAPNADCQYEEDAGDCTLFEQAGTGPRLKGCY